MTKTQFLQKIFTTFTESEMRKINLKIYYKPEHIIYYENYHAGLYEKCFQYLVDNRNLLTDEN